MASDLHPDINEISAYLEGGLNRGARRGLEAHLSRCTACRELTACASLALGSPAKPLRLRWQAPLALAASAILVAGVVWSLSIRPGARRVLASVPAATLLPRAAALPAAAAPAPRLMARSSAPVAMPVQWAQLKSPAPVFSLPAPPAPPAAALAPALNFASLRNGFQDQVSAHYAPSSLVDWGGVTAAQPALASRQSALIEVPTPMQAALPALNSETAWPLAAGFASDNASAEPAPDSPQLAAELGWAISRSGALLRSMTAGLWHAVPFVPGVQVRVIYVKDGHVWVGGNANELFTSTDRGKHWQRVLLPGLSSRPVVLRNIVFLDSQHGLITAASGQSWTTNDGGRTWVPR